MKTLKKSIAGVVMLPVLALTYPHAACWAGSPLFAKTEKTTITRHEPKVLSTPAEDIPVVQAEPGEQKGANKWLWIGLGVLAIGGIAAAAGGGGGGGDGNGGDTGSVTVGW